MSDVEENRTEAVGEDKNDAGEITQEPEITNPEDTESKEQGQEETETHETQVEEKEETKQDEQEPTKEDREDVEKTDSKPEVVPVATGAALEKDEYEAKIRENEALTLKLESALSNQQAEREAYKKLTEENAKLQKHHDDMKAKFDEMEGTHVVLSAELETLRDVNEKNKDTIKRLEADVKLLRETQGGDERMKDLQEKLIRLSNDQEQKDKKIHSLEGELDATREKLKDAESRAERGGNKVQNSKTCVVM